MKKKYLLISSLIFLAILLLLSTAWTQTMENDPPNFTQCPSEQTHGDTGWVTLFGAIDVSDYDGQIVEVTINFLGDGVSQVQLDKESSLPQSSYTADIKYHVDNHCLTGGIITVTAKDDAAAESICQFTITLTNQPPVINCPPKTDDFYNEIIVSEDFSTIHPDGDPASVIISSVNPEPNGSYSIVDDHVEFNATPEDVGEDYLFTLKVTEDSPCDSSDTCSFTMTATNDPPSFTTTPGNKNIGCDSTGLKSEQFVVEDQNDNIDSVIVSFNGLGITPLTVCDNSGIGTKHVSGYVCYDVDNHCDVGGVVTLTAYDQAGDTGQCQFTITLSNQPPVINCPSNVVGAYNKTMISSDFDTSDECSGVTPTVVIDSVTQGIPANYPIIVGSHVEWNPTLDDVDIPYRIWLSAIDDCDSSNTCSFTMTATKKAPNFTKCPSNEIRNSNGTGFKSEEFEIQDQDDEIKEVIVEFNGPGVEKVELCDTTWYFFRRRVSGYICYDVIDHCQGDPGTFTITAEDNQGNTGQCQFTITLTNQAPTIDAGQNRSGPYNATLYSDVITTGDANGDNVTWVITSVNPEPDGEIEKDGDKVKFSATCNDVGTVYTITLTPTDTCELDGDSKEFTMTVLNSPPEFTTCLDSDSVHGGNNFVSSDFLVSDLEEPFAVVVRVDSIYPSATNVPSIVENHVEWITTRDEDGVYTIWLVATDACGLEDTCEFTVTAYNRAPILDPIADQEVDEGQRLELPIHATDPDGDSIILSDENRPYKAKFYDYTDGSGLFTFDPESNQAGTYNVTFKASDELLIDSEIVEIVVNNIDLRPEISDIPDQAIWRGGVFYSITLDSYVRDDDLKSNIKWTNLPSDKIDVYISPSRVVTLTPQNPNWYGFDSITFTATDTGGLSDSDVMVASVCEYLPRSLTFDETRVGSFSVTKNVIIYNTKPSVLTINNHQYDAVNFELTYPRSIPAYSQGEAKVTFHPTYFGSISTNVKLNPQGMSPIQFSCEGVGLQESLVVSFDSIDFGKVNVEDTSETWSVKVKNKGNDSTEIKSITSTEDVFIVQDQDCIGWFNPGESCDFEVYFSPKEKGNKGGWIILHHTYGDMNCVQLLGQGVQPVLEVTPDNIDFGEVYTNEDSIEIISIKNAGEGFLFVDSVIIIDSVNFSFSNEPLPTDTIFKDIPVLVEVAFTPTGLVGKKTSWLVVYANAGIDSVYLEGVHKKGNIEIQTWGRDFHEVRIDTCDEKEDCYIKNAWETPLSFIVDSVLFETGTYFIAHCVDCPETLETTQGYNTLYYDLDFCPDDTGEFRDNLLFFLTFLPEEKDSIIKYWMEGTGTAPQIWVDSTSLNFDSVATGDTSDCQWIEIKNNGKVVLRITKTDPKHHPAEFLVKWEDGVPPPRNLNPQESKKVGVRFAPANIGKRTDILQIFSNAYPDKDTLIEISLEGEGYQPDPFPPNVKVLDFDADLGDTLTLRAFVTDYPSGVDKVWLYHRQGNSNDFVFGYMKFIEDSTYEYIIPPDSVTLDGLEYRIGAVDKHDPPNDTTLPLKSIRVEFHSGEVTQHSSFWYTNLQAAIDTTRWVMISIPGDLDDKSNSLFAKTIGPPGNESWKIIGYERGAYQIYDKTNSTPFYSGKSFWFKNINRSDSFTVNLESGKTCLTHVPFSIELTSKDWTMISNPYFFDLDLINYLCNNDSLFGPVQWNGKWVFPCSLLADNPDTQIYLEPWVGYAVYNFEESDFDLKLDPHSSTQAAVTYLPSSDFLWRIRMAVKAGGFKDDNNFLGSCPSCCQSKDNQDLMKPPSIEPSLSLYFPKLDWGKWSASYAADYRGVIGEGALWNFVVDNFTDCKILELSWQEITSLPPELEAVLYDRMKNICIDMRKKQSYNFTHFKNQDYDRFKILIGNSGYVEEQISSTLSEIPGKFELRQNYPNPFNAKTTISFDVSRGCRVRVRIYNILGQVVKTLYDQQTYPGSHSVIWDGKDNQGQEVSSGIYFCKLSSPEFTKCLKMLLLK